MKDYKALLSSAPAHSILNAQAFHYTSSAATDIRKTFARVRRRREKADAASLNVARASVSTTGPTTAMTVLADVLPMRRTHACRHLHSAGPEAILRSVDPRTSSTDTSARSNTIPRCSPPEPSAIADASVWLECNGELIDVRSVDVLGIREATPGIELLEFDCPRCRTPHASLRFG